jgi:hypothetical protein
MNIKDLFANCGFNSVKVVGFNVFSAGKAYKVIQSIFSVIATVEQCSKDGKIDKNDKKLIAQKIITELFNNLGIGVTQEQISIVIDVVVNIFDALNMFKKSPPVKITETGVTIK